MAENNTVELLKEYGELLHHHNLYSYAAHAFLLEHEDNPRFVELTKIHRIVTRATLEGRCGKYQSDIENRALYDEDTPRVKQHIKEHGWKWRLSDLCKPFPPLKKPQELTEYINVIKMHGPYASQARTILDTNSTTPNFYEWAAAIRLNKRCKQEIQEETVSVEDNELYSRDTPLARKIREEIENFRKEQ
ncbi:hypothetical protein J4219_05400 [Candidatus Woesearchaeota archaeon]|nr:hypothetical protein [Candidatus Woesearchaeota archaeon]